MKQIYSHLLLSIFMLVGVVATASGQYTGTGTFKKVTSLADLTDGYYVIATATNFVMTNTNKSNFFESQSLTLTNSEVVNPATGIVWNIVKGTSDFTIQSVGNSKFVSYSGTGNYAYLVDAASTSNQKWTATYASNLFSIINVALPTRFLQYNASSPRFTCYTNSQVNLVLYKLAAAPTTPTLDVISPLSFGSQGVNLTATQSFRVKGVNLTGDLTVTVAGDGFSGSTTVTKDEAEAGKDVTVTFLPTSLGDKSGTVTISGGGLATDIQVNLSGTAISTDPVLNTIADLDFGKVAIGMTKSMAIFVKGAFLTDDLTVAVEGSDFSCATTTVTAAQANDGISIPIVFSSSIEGNVTGIITISGSDISPVEIALSGEGIVAPVDLITPFSDSSINGVDYTFVLDQATNYKVLNSTKSFRSTNLIAFSKYGDATLLINARTYGGGAPKLMVQLSADGINWNDVSSIAPANSTLKNYSITIKSAVNAYIRFLPLDCTPTIGVGFDLVKITAMAKDPVSTPSMEQSNVRVITESNGVRVLNANRGEMIRVYSATGAEVVTKVATDVNESIALGKGFFVVKVGNHATKIAR